MKIYVKRNLKLYVKIEKIINIKFLIFNFAIRNLVLNTNKKRQKHPKFSVIIFSSPSLELNDKVKPNKEQHKST